MSYLATKQQHIRFSGVGAAHQNAITERAIQTITYTARTLLIHVSLRTMRLGCITTCQPNRMARHPMTSGQDPKTLDSRIL
eukprot:9099135-Ditylum_brightwellii.AAC.1